jgi:hypothetical protein
VGKPIKQLKQHRNLAKAIELADNIARKEVRFKEACKQWAAGSKVSTGSHKISKSPRSSSKEEVSEKPAKGSLNKEVERKNKENEPKSRSRTGRKEEGQTPTKPQRETDNIDLSVENRVAIKPINYKPKPIFSVHREPNSKEKEKKFFSTGGKPTVLETKEKVLKANEVKNRKPLDDKKKSKAKEKRPQDKGLENSSSYSSESELVKSSSQIKKAKQLKSKVLTTEKTEPDLNKVNKSSKDISVTPFREKETSSKKKFQKSNLLIEPYNYPTLSVLEETPREMTPIKSPRLIGPRSDFKTKSKKSFKDKQPSENPQSNEKFISKKHIDLSKSIIKKSIRKASGAKKDKLNPEKDSDNSSYNTEVFEQMYDQLKSKDEIKEAIQLKDIIPLRDNSRTHSTITASSTPIAPCNDFEKKEFFMDDSHQAGNEGSEMLEESMLLLSTDQRNHILRSDAELERCMKDFQEVEQVYNLHKTIPRNQIDLNDLFSRLVTICKKAEIYKLPPEVLLSNNIGASINTINLIVKKISHLIPEEHKDVTLVLDKCVGILVRRLEDYVKKLNFSTLEEMISLKNTILDQNLRKVTSPKDLLKLSLTILPDPRSRRRTTSKIIAMFKFR